MAGPFYWAWVAADETTFTTDHMREDEDIFSFVVKQAEGEFASLTMEVRNPRIGLLAPARKIWGWLSWDDGSETLPLFFGRLVGIPDDIHLEVVTLIFTARPADYTARKTELADTLRVAPFYDPVFIDENKRIDPDVVLEARAELWHIDRVTHEVTTSNALVGEDGNEEFLVIEVPYDSVTVRMNAPPLRAVSVDGTVNWTQTGKGALDVKRNAHFLTYTGDGLISDWPKTGSSLGGGWTVVDGRVADAAQIAPIADDRFQVQGVFTDLPFPDSWLRVPTVSWSFVTSQLSGGVLVPLWDVVGTLRIGYDVQRQYKEHLTFTLQANLQSLVTLPDESEVLQISVNGADVGEPIDDVIPIGNVRRRQYFATDRGTQSVEYLIALARAHLLVRSRAVDVEFQCRFARAVQLSCRKNALLHDPRLPGGSALGKITAYSFSVTGEGEMIGSVTMGCAIGYGGAVTEIAGDPLYVDDDYVEGGYQEHENELVVLGPGDVAYSRPGGTPDDDGLNLEAGITKWQVVSNETAVNLYNSQRAIVAGLGAFGLDTDAVAEIIKARLETVGTKISFYLKPIEGGPFESSYHIMVSDLEVPAMLNLEASS